MKKRHAKKKITLEDLAVMVQRGFSDTVSKTEFGNLKTEFGGLKTEFTRLKGEFGTFRQEVKYFQDKTDKSLFSLQSDMSDTRDRVKKIEHILGPLLSRYE